MAKHIVKCAICGQNFDLSSVQGVRHGTRRYAHFECYPEGEKVPMETPPEEDYVALTDYINKLFDEKANWAIIGKQIKQYKTEFNYTYSGMLKSLVYAYDVKKNDISKARGVGLIPYYYKEAWAYYYSIWEAQQRNINKPIDQYIMPEETITIPPPERKTRKRKIFTFLDREERNEF